MVWALCAVYLFWGTSYLAIKQAGEDFPPMLLVGLRNVLAGALVLVCAGVLKRPFGELRQWAHAACVGVLMIAVGASLLAMGLRHVNSGHAALLFALVPMVVCLLMAVQGRPMGRIQWLGTALGISGLLLMGQADAVPMVSVGVWLILAAVVATAASAVLMDHWPMPRDLMVATGIQMVAGGAAASVLGWVWGERVTEVSQQGWMAWLYLSLMVSVLGYMSYTYLLLHTGPVLASSYAYVNPPIALLVGAWFLGEPWPSTGVWGMGLVLLGAMAVLFASPVRTDHKPVAPASF